MKVSLNKNFELKKDKWYSGDINSIVLMLGGASENEYPLEKDFMDSIRRREEFFGGFHSEKNPFEE